MCSAPSRPPALPPPPDAADSVIRDAAAAERRRAMGTAGRQSTFLSGLAGDVSPVPTMTKNLLGK